MGQIRTGWEELFIAQLLWAKVLAKNHECQFSFASPNTQGVGLEPVNGADLPTGLRDELRRLAVRADMVASCICDVCGKHAVMGTRCNDHQGSTPSSDSIEIQNIWESTTDPMVQLNSMISECVDFALMGPTALVLDMMEQDDQLYAAVCTRNEVARVDDPCGDRAAQLVMQADRRSTRRACRRTRNADGRTRYYALSGLEEHAFWCQGTDEVLDLLVKDPMLEAVARTCVRYRQKKLGRRLTDALAILDSERVRKAIEHIG